MFKDSSLSLLVKPQPSLGRFDFEIAGASSNPSQELYTIDLQTSRTGRLAHKLPTPFIVNDKAVIGFEGSFP